MSGRETKKEGFEPLSTDGMTNGSVTVVWINLDTYSSRPHADRPDWCPPQTRSSMCVVGFPAPNYTLSTLFYTIFWATTIFFCQKLWDLRWRNWNKSSNSWLNMVSFPLQLYLSWPSPTNSPCCYVPHMLWWLLFWKGEMIQIPGMHGRTAAGHCTCSSKKKPCWGVHVWPMHVYVCTVNDLAGAHVLFSYIKSLLCFWQHFSLFPAIFISLPPFFSTIIVPTHAAEGKLKSVWDVWRSSGLSHGS